MNGSNAHAKSLAHAAFTYRDRDEYVSAANPFVESAVRAGERVLVAVPPDKVELIRGTVNCPLDRVRFVDVHAVGRNPAWLIPALLRFSDRDSGRVHILGEPVWPGRDAAETEECFRHEALINVAFARRQADLLCPYNAQRLPRQVLANMRRSHPVLIEGPRRYRSDQFTDPHQVALSDQPPLPEPPDTARSFALTADALPGLRSVVQRFALESGLARHRADDLVLASHEAATNSVQHAEGPATLRMWNAENGVFCEVSDTGQLTDPLVGRIAAPSHDRNGRGMWLIHQLCDLVQIRSAPGRTTLRMRCRN